MAAKTTTKKTLPAKKRAPAAKKAADDMAAKLEELADTPEPEPLAPIAEVRNVSAGVISQWGPFEQNTYVTTPYGDYGLPAGQVMSFEQASRLDKDTLEMVTFYKPVRRRATPQEIATAGVDMSHMAPSAAFHNAEVAKDTAQIMEITINGEGSFPGVVKRAPVQEKA